MILAYNGHLHIKTTLLDKYHAIVSSMEGLFFLCGGNFGSCYENGLTAHQPSVKQEQSGAAFALISMSHK